MRPAIPELSELDPASLLVLHASIATDLALRTMVGSVVGGVMLAGTARGHRDDLRYYAELADLHDAEAVFCAPPEVDVKVSSRRGPDVPGVRVDVLSFESPYVAVNPAVRDRYAEH